MAEINGENPGGENVVDVATIFDLKGNQTKAIVHKNGDVTVRLIGFPGVDKLDPKNLRVADISQLRTAITTDAFINGIVLTSDSGEKTDVKNISDQNKLDILLAEIAKRDRYIQYLADSFIDDIPTIPVDDYDNISSRDGIDDKEKIRLLILLLHQKDKRISELEVELEVLRKEKGIESQPPKFDDGGDPTNDDNKKTPTKDDDKTPPPFTITTDSGDTKPTTYSLENAEKKKKRGIGTGKKIGSIAAILALIATMGFKTVTQERQVYIQSDKNLDQEIGGLNPGLQSWTLKDFETLEQVAREYGIDFSEDDATDQLFERFSYFVSNVDNPAQYILDLNAMDNCYRKLTSDERELVEEKLEEYNKTEQDILVEVNRIRTSNTDLAFKQMMVKRLNELKTKQLDIYHELSELLASLTSSFDDPKDSSQKNDKYHDYIEQLGNDRNKVNQLDNMIEMVLRDHQILFSEKLPGKNDAVKSEFGKTTKVRDARFEGELDMKLDDSETDNLVDIHSAKGIISGREMLNLEVERRHVVALADLIQRLASGQELPEDIKWFGIDIDGK